MIVVLGEALVDLIPTAAGDLGVHPGGGPFNTARWLGRLGADVAFMGAIAADPLGQRLRDELSAAGVALDLVAPTPLPTTLALAQLDADGAAAYSFYIEGTSIPELRAGAVDALRALDLDALYVGSIGLMLEPSASAALRAVAIARERGAFVMVDPNVRPALIADRDAYLARLHRVLRAADVLKLSVEDLGWLAPGVEPGEAAHGILLEHGLRAVVLTAGAEGASVLTPDGHRASVAPVPVEVVDTIGAGDAFSAGFLAHTLRQPTAGVAAAAGFAARVAALACGVQGAAPPADLGALA